MVILNVTAAMLIVAIMGDFVVLHSPAVQKGPAVWLAFGTAIFCEFIYAVCAIVTIVLRRRNLPAGRIAAKMLNIALLALFPIGTVIGIYGLLKVDRERK